MNFKVAYHDNDILFDIRIYNDLIQGVCFPSENYKIELFETTNSTIHELNCEQELQIREYLISWHKEQQKSEQFKESDNYYNCGVRPENFY